MKKILVITDFSVASKNASLYAIELAKLSGAKVLLYNSSTDNISNSKISESIEINNEKYKLKDDIQIDTLKSLSSIKIELLVAKDTLVEDVLSIEKNESIDLVIIGIKDNAYIIEPVFEDIITDLIKKTIVPLLIIPQKTNFKKIEKIVFTIDFNLETELKMHKPIKKLLQYFNPEIFLLNVVKENAEILPNKKNSEYNIEKYFENKRHIYSFIENNDLINGLKDFISCHNIDMITMLPHKHNFLQNIFIESQSKKMAFSTTIPLMIFPINK